MAKCFIGFGKCSYFYLYLLAYFIFNIIKRLLFNGTFEDLYFRLSIFHHNIIQNIVKYFSYIILGLIFFYISKKNKKFKKKDNEIMINNSSNSIVLIYNNVIITSQKHGFLLIFICFIYICYIELLRILIFFQFSPLIFWTAHIAFIIVFMKYYFPESLHKHQIYPMIFIIIIDTILIFITSLLKMDNKDKNVYQINGIFTCIFVIIFYIFIVCFFSYSEVSIKYLVDIKFFSPYKIIIFLGVMGILLTFVISLFFSVFGACNNNDDKKDKIFCYNDIIPYFDELSDKSITQLSVEVFIMTPIYFFLEFFSIVCCIFIIVYLNPNHLLLADNTFFLIYNIINFITKSDNTNKDTKNKYILNICSEIIEIIGFLIFLEIIELRFLGLNKNIKRNIYIRSEIDSHNNDYRNNSKTSFDSHNNNYRDSSLASLDDIIYLDNNINDDNVDNEDGHKINL